MQKRKILMLTTGGTIASLITTDGLKPSLGGDALLNCLNELPDYKVDTVEVCNLDSTNIGAEQWVELVRVIESKYNDYDGFVVCHGTDTMAYTAAALSYMIQNSPKPIVITGAQKPISDDITDAKTNLQDALIYAGDLKSQSVKLVFNGKVIKGTRAKKTRANSYDAFSSINFPIVANIRNGKIYRYIKNEKHSDKPVFHYNMHDSVVLIKLIPNTKPELLEYIFENYDCIIIESFGVGGIPQSLRDSFYNQLSKYESKGKIIIIQTQVAKEGSNMEVYEVGKIVKQDFRLIEAYDMTLESTIAKSMYILDKFGTNLSTFRKEFYTTVDDDIIIADE